MKKNTQIDEEKVKSKRLPILLNYEQMKLLIEALESVGSTKLSLELVEILKEGVELIEMIK